MSRALLLTLLCVLSAHPLCAQSARDILAAEVDSLAAERALRVARLARLDSVARESARSVERDTVMLGPVRFIDAPHIVRQYSAALLAAWRAFEPFVGDGRARLEGSVITATVPPAHLDPAQDIHTLSLFEEGGSTRARNAARVVGAVAAAALPSDLQTWLAGAVPVPRELEWVYRQLATSAALPARRCHEGNTDACMAALGFTGTDAELPPAARASLLQHALESGGEGSWARLFAAAPDPGARLAAAAGRPLPDVVASWHGAVHAARPRVHADTGRAVGWTLLWLLLFTFLARRSTRWRLG